jgi:mannose-1-phosphate guanylyltransferase
MRAFVLGAGLGKRLRPLTDLLPKPLVPVWQRPLITYAFDHLRSLGIQEFVINTHHLPAAYPTTFPQGHYLGCPLHFRNEPILLETGGGLANVADLLHDAPCAIYNGDILTDLPLAEAKMHHFAAGNLVTLVLRSTGQVRNVAFDDATGRVLDLRNALGTNHPNQVQFTGLYFVNPGFFKYLIPGSIESVVEAFLRAIQAGERVGGIVINAGNWWDLGDPDSYREAHAAYAQQHAVEKVHPTAHLAAGAEFDSTSCISENCHVAAGARLENTILWPGARIAANAHLINCIVRPGTEITGQWCGEIL